MEKHGPHFRNSNMTAGKTMWTGAMFARNLRVVRGGARNFSASALRRKVEEDVSLARFYDLLQNTKGGKPLLVDFYADWCQPCKLLSPILKKLASTPQLTGNNEVDLATIDVDKYVDLAQQYNIRAMPTVIAFKNGKQENAFIGVLPEARIVDFIKGL